MHGCVLTLSTLFARHGQAWMPKTLPVPYSFINPCPCTALQDLHSQCRTIKGRWKPDIQSSIPIARGNMKKEEARFAAAAALLGSRPPSAWQPRTRVHGQAGGRAQWLLLLHNCR